MPPNRSRSSDCSAAAMSGFQQEPTNLADLLTELGSALDWLKGFGIQPNQTRCAKTEKNLNLVLQHT